LHAPAFAHDLLPRVRAKVVVDVKHGGTVVGLRDLQQAFGHAGIERRVAAGLCDQSTQQPPHPACARHPLGAQQRWARRCCQPAHALDAALTDRERAHHRVERDPQPVAMLAAESLVRLVVQAHLRREREQDPAAEVLDLPTAVDRLRGHRHDLSRAFVLGHGRRRLALRVRCGPQRQLVVVRVRRARSDRLCRGRSLAHDPLRRLPLLVLAPHGRVPAPAATWLLAKHHLRRHPRRELRAPRRTLLRRHLAVRALAQQQHRAQAASFVLTSQTPQVVVTDPERLGEPAQMGARVCDRHHQHVALATFPISVVVLAEQRTADEHAADRAANDHAPARRERADLESGRVARRLQRQGESFHRLGNNAQPLRIPVFSEFDPRLVTPRHPISSRALV